MYVETRQGHLLNAPMTACSTALGMCSRIHPITFAGATRMILSVSFMRTACASRLIMLLRRSVSAFWCRSVCSSALRAVPARSMTRPGRLVPSSCVSFPWLDAPHMVTRLGAQALPLLRSTNACPPSQTATRQFSGTRIVEFFITVPAVQDLRKNGCGCP